MVGKIGNMIAERVKSRIMSFMPSKVSPKRSIQTEIYRIGNRPYWSIGNPFPLHTQQERNLINASYRRILTYEMKIVKDKLVG